MSLDLEEFRHDIFQEVVGDADAGGKFLEEAFLTHFSDYLIDAGEFDTFDPAFYKSANGQLRVDGYAGDPGENDGVLSLFIADFHPQGEAGTLTRADAEKLFKRVERFFREAMSPDFHQQLEETSAGFGLAEMIHRRQGDLARARLFILSNRLLSARVDGFPPSTIENIPVSYNVWDVSRLHRLASSQKRREDIVIDLAGDFGEALPCLPASVGETSYEAYLAVVPASILARLYERWGARLLEQNVRCFLQARGKVNKGIRNTILNDPGMFFAYNNGITATAEYVDTEVSGGTVRIRSMRNFQIVNGGQTTASLFSAFKKDKADIDGIFVQMKLSVVQPDEAVNIVPKISEYANSQNRVNAADFFANHPFHVRMEDSSRRVWAPSPDDSYHESKWFYERARGQYLDAKAYLSVAQKKKFDRDYPKAQSFTKTDLAKFENVWEGMPHIVSKGAQYNFAEYARRIGQRWEKDSDQYNEMYFHDVVAKGIVFRILEKLVMQQSWYDGGYRANIVAYTIAKLSELVKATKKEMDFDLIWKAQSISPAMEEALLTVAQDVHGIIAKPPLGTSNVTEWAKKEACWQRVQGLDTKLPESFKSELILQSEKKKAGKDAKKVRKMDNGIEAQKLVIGLGADFWKKTLEWDREHSVLTGKDHQIMAVAAAVPARVPTEKQSLHLVDVLDRLREEACPFAQNV